MNTRDLLLLLGITGTLTAGTVLPSCSGEPSQGVRSRPVAEESQEKVSEQTIREAILSYISASKRFSGTDLVEKVTGTKANLEMWQLNEGMLYFTILENEYTDDTLAKLTTNPQNVEFGELKRNKLTLGDYSYSIPGRYLFRFPSSEFKVDRKRTIRKGYGDVAYALTMEELCDFIENRSIYGGKVYVKLGKDRLGRLELFANHGVMVAKKGEKSLERLAAQLTRNAKTKEEKAQALLDFVTKEIKYDFTTRFYDAETLKRPNEVLLSGDADCSGKTILFASLLEQTDIDYRMVYFKKHISVAVEGNYGNANDLSFKLGEKTYSIAEPTAEWFRIGKSKPNPLSGINPKIEDIRAVQKPGPDSKIYNAKTGKAMEFK